MFISLDWISDFTSLPTDKTPEELGHSFTMRSAEVEEVQVQGAHLEKIRVVEVQEINKHPESDKLSLVKFFEKEGELLEVVCGANNLRIGMKAAYAPVGTTFPDGLTLEARKIRGVISNGMLCSEKELGIGEDHDGIWDIPAEREAKLGQSMSQLLGAGERVVIEIDNKSITHRPDLWGHLGIAREFAASFQTELKLPFSDEWKESMLAKLGSGDSPIGIEIKEGTSCLCYYGISVDGVKVEPSPHWMQQRLLDCGLRPINNLVDIGNYVMLETGGPLHIFDRSKIAGDKIVMRCAEDGEELELLDETKAKLIASDTLVSDSEKALVLAGIMGGLESGVADDTSQIFIEAANWDASAVRQSSTRLNVRTDSSMRFEKALDSFGVPTTILRALELVLELCPGAEVRGKLEQAGNELGDAPKREIELSIDKAQKLLGRELSKEDIRRALEPLGFSLTESAPESFTVTVPSFRAGRDIEVAADLIEEIGRVIGYDTLAEVAPLAPVAPRELSRKQKIHRKVRDTMVLSERALEVFCPPLIGEKLLADMQWPEHNEGLKLQNALSSDRDRMRPALLPSLIEAAVMNQKHYSAFRMFELGRVYLPDEKDFSTEHNRLAVVYFSRSDQGLFVRMCESFERLIQSLGVNGKVLSKHTSKPSQVIPESWAGLHPQLHQEIELMGRRFGVITQMHPLLLKALKVRGQLVVAELDLSPVEDLKKERVQRYETISNLPSSDFDCSVVVPKRTEVTKVLEAAKKSGVKQLVSAKVLDVFELESGDLSVTVRSRLHDPKKTISSEDLKNYEEKIVAGLEKAGFPLRPADA